MLANLIARLLNPSARVLDVGCGDGLIDKKILKQRDDIHITGVDVKRRELNHISVDTFDGHRLPYPDRSFDDVVVIDVLHHTEDPSSMLSEISRVARNAIIIKDHFADGTFSRSLLRLMDWVGNARYGVTLPYNYWTEKEWRASFNDHRLVPVAWATKLYLYPKPIDCVFGRSLHFLTKLEKN